MAKAGWQQVKIRRNWSSRTAASLGRSAVARFRRSALSRSFAPRVASRRSASIALRRATTVSQARGSLGIPDRGPSRSADTIASCTASSATGKPPAVRISVASMRAPSIRTASASRSTGSTTSHPGDDRSQFDRSAPCGRNASGDLYGRVQVGGIDDVITRERFFGFGIWSVRGHHIAATCADHADHGGGGRRVKDGGGSDRVAVLFAELAILGQGVCLLRGGPVNVLGVREGQVMRHGCSSVRLSGPDAHLENWTNGTGRFRTSSQGDWVAVPTQAVLCPLAYKVAAPLARGQLDVRPSRSGNDRSVG